MFYSIKANSIYMNATLTQLQSRYVLTVSFSLSFPA